MDMNINLNIVATGLCEAINNLAGALVGMGSNSVGAVEQVPVIRKPRAAKVAEVATVVEPAEVIPEEVKATDAALVVETSGEVVQAEKVTPAEAAPTFTLEAVRDKLKEISSPANNPKIKELFAKFGAKKLTEVPEANYAELMADAELIG